MGVVVVPKISLITTTYNRPEMLLECAVSVARQSLQPHEWIIYLDHDDPTPYNEVIPLITELVPQTKWVGNKRVGRVNALALAHEFVTGDYIGWLDDDDWLDPDCLKLCCDRGELVYTDFYEVRNDRVTIGLRNTEPYSYQRFLQNNIVFHFRLFSKALYDAVGGVDTTYDTTMDYELTLRMAKQVVPVKVNQPLYYYRIHRNRISVQQHHRQLINRNRAVQQHGLLFP